MAGRKMGIVVTDGIGVAISANRTMLDVIGSTISELQARGMHAAALGIPPEIVRRTITAPMDDENVIHWDLQPIKRLDGHYVAMHVWSTVIDVGIRIVVFHVHPQFDDARSAEAAVRRIYSACRA